MEVSNEQNIYQYTIKTLRGEDISLSTFKGKALLIVNTASKCGFTKQFEGLETLYKEFKEKGLVIIGFPFFQFAGQEFDGSGEIEAFCSVNYGVTFLMSQKIKVNGKDADPIYNFLKNELSGFGPSAIKWNFTKFLVDMDGTPIKRYPPQFEPSDISCDIEILLNVKNN